MTTSTLISKSDFIATLKNLKLAYSATGKNYHIHSVNSRNIEFSRESGNNEAITIDELYSVYLNCSFINTSVVRDFISGRKFSPSVAILKTAGLYDEAGYRTTNHLQSSKNIISPDSVVEKTTSTSNEKDETRFFKSFANLFPGNVISKSLNRTVNTNEVYLNDDYRLMYLPEEIENQIKEILSKLYSDFNFKGNSLTSYIDGLLYEHPALGTRIIEFDEEQHFSPARQITLEGISDASIAFKTFYLTMLHKEEIYISFLKKNRLNLSSNKQNSFENLIEELNLSKLSGSGYIAPKSGFNYMGGRIAQRAYYDLLRDVSHLSSRNKTLKPILRFPKVLFEMNYNKRFAELNLQEIENYLLHLLKEVYNYY